MVAASWRAPMPVKELDRMIMKVADMTALTTDEVQSLAAELYRAGLRGGALEVALEGAAYRASAIGGSAADFLAMGYAAGSTAQSIAALAKIAKDKFQGPMLMNMLTLERQTAKFKNNLSRLFKDVKIEKFLLGLNGILMLFSQNTREGVALKQLCEVLLNPLMEAASFLAPILYNMFRGAIIGAQRLTIAALKAGLAIKKALDIPELKKFAKDMDLVDVSVEAGMYIFFGILAAVVAFTAVLVIATVAIAAFIGLLVIGIAIALIPAIAMFAVFAAAAMLVALPFILIPALIIGLGYAIGMALEWFLELIGVLDSTSGAADSMSSTFEGLSFFDTGANLIQGLIDGITSKVGDALSAVSNLAGGISGALKSALGIASPSKLFAGYGKMLGAGLEQGIDAGSGLALGATEDMAAGVASVGAGSAAGVGGSAGASKGGNTYYVTISGVKDADEMRSESFMDKVAEAFERAAMTAGLEGANA